MITRIVSNDLFYLSNNLCLILIYAVDVLKGKRKIYPKNK